MQVSLNNRYTFLPGLGWSLPSLLANSCLWCLFLLQILRTPHLSLGASPPDLFKDSFCGCDTEGINSRCWGKTQHERCVKSSFILYQDPGGDYAMGFPYLHSSHHGLFIPTLAASLSPQTGPSCPHALPVFFTATHSPGD